MADDDQPDESSKTEDPTSKKLEEARKRGQVAQSKEMNNWLMIFAATILIGTVSGGMALDMTDYLRTFLEQPHLLPALPGGLGPVLSDLTIHTIGFVALPLMVLFIAALAGPFAQIGFLVAPEVLKPDFSKVSIMKGFGRLFSIRSVVEFLKGLIKLVVVGIVAYYMIVPFFDGIEATISQTLSELLANIHTLTMKMMTGILVVLLIMSLADLFYQRWEFNKQMRMTKQEVKDEYKQTEGDPHVKGKLKQLRMEKARQRMMAAVPKADVVITNPTHFAVALQYDADGMDAPKVIAKGVDTVAFRIREVAQEHNIEVVENPPVARALYDQVELDQSIPPDMFKAVAEIISYVYQKKGKLKPRKG